MAGRRARRIAGTALALAVVAWAALVVVWLLQARGQLAAAQDRLTAARQALAGTDVARARGSFDGASEHLSRAHRRLTAPHVRPLTVVPMVGADLRTTIGLTEAASMVADAGAEATAAVSGLPGGLDALVPRDGAVPVASIARLAGPLEAAADTIARAATRASATPERGLLPAVQRRRTGFVAELEAAVRQSRSAASVVAAMPELLGLGEQRRYFVGAATPAELRGTGGYIGAFSIVTVRDGRLDFGAWQATSDLPTLPPDTVEPPHGTFRERYDRYGGAGHWQNINMTPDFPTAATAIERLWEATTGERLDGTVVVDPFALRALLAATGPVEVPGYTVLDADTVVPYVTTQAYEDITDQDRRKELLGTVAASALQRFLEGGTDADSASTLRTVAEVVGEDHLLVHATDPELQAALEATGVAGELSDGAGDLVAVVVNNGSGTKLDAFLDRRLDYRVRLLSGGAARGHLVARLSSTAPTDGLDPYVIGPNVEDLAAGENLSLVSVFAPRDGDLTDAPGVPSAAPASRGTELGHPVHDHWVRVPAGGAVALEYRWEAPAGWQVDDRGDLVYRLTYHHQTTVRPTRLRLELRVPDGFAVVEVPDGARVERGAVVWEDPDASDTVLEVRLRPVQAGGFLADLGRWLADPALLR